MDVNMLTDFVAQHSSVNQRRRQSGVALTMVRLGSAQIQSRVFLHTLSTELLQVTLMSHL